MAHDFNLFKKEEDSGEGTGYFAVIIQNMKTYESHEMIRYAVRLPCRITGRCDKDNYIIGFDHGAEEVKL